MIEFFKDNSVDKAIIEENFDEKKLGVTELVCDINGIKLDLAAILKNLCCYGNGCQANIVNFGLLAQHLDFLLPCSKYTFTISRNCKKLSAT